MQRYWFFFSYIMKTVFIAHPMTGDFEGNFRRVLEICREVHEHDESVIPVAPYIISFEYRDGVVHEDRTLGIAANYECFRRKYVDEVWLYGDHISEGTKAEIGLARQYDIPIIPKTQTVQE